MRTAGFRPPCTPTWPTPDTCDSFCATSVSAISLNCLSEAVGEVSAKVAMGASAGFTFA
jgi:hypothetical protein